MKQVRYALWIFFILATIYTICVINTDFTLRQFFALYHNTGEINVTVDGKKLNLNNHELSYILDGDEISRTTTIHNGKFKCMQGRYGNNRFSLILPDIISKDITIEFGHFNTNSWHKVDYKVNVDMNTSDNDTIIASIEQVVFIDSKELFRDKKNNILIGKQNTEISITSGP